MENEKKEKSFFPQEYKWQQMVLIGLGVLSIGFAIAFIGYGYMMRNNSIMPIYPNPFKLPASNPSAGSASPTPPTTTISGHQTNPTPTPIGSNPTEHKICNADTDCNSGETCIAGGPANSDRPIIKSCWPKGSILPM